MTSVTGRVLGVSLLLLTVSACESTAASREPSSPSSESGSAAAAEVLAPTERVGLINPAHLDFLTEPVVVDGEPMAFVHIYSEAPDYRWVDASGEGLTAVDDVARAAVVYLELADRYEDPAAMERARLSLNFVMRMQAEDGDYYNFVTDRAGTINVDGPTSHQDWGWWAARAQWALARGIAVFEQQDADYTERLREHYLRGEAALEAVLGQVGQYNELHGDRLPGWLLKDGTDVSALALLGLAEYHSVAPNPATQRLAYALGQGVAESRLGTSRDYPFGLRPSTVNSTAYWHAWGAHSVQALARAGEVFDRGDWVRAAAAEADTWFTRLLITGVVREVGVIPNRYDQIAYGHQMLVGGFAALAQATGNDEYRRLAGLAAAWFVGDNPAGVRMYDPDTGRVFDGINGANEFMVNQNAGAESTIEGLLALLAVVDDPVALPYLEATSQASVGPVLVEAEQASVVSGDPGYGQAESTGEAFFSGDRYLTLSAGDAIEAVVTIPEPGDFDLYLAHERQAPVARDPTVTGVRPEAPVMIDGDLDEWSAASWLAADSPEHILRGASAWPGPDEASLAAAVMWDDEALYLAAEVSALRHVQDAVGPDVSRGDAVWMYLDTTGTGRRVDLKLTLAQTPDGPQVWNWVGGAFQPAAELVWKQSDGGYRYEAALPWSSLNRTAPEPGATLGFDIGMGFPGGFIDWTGTDPDTPANLAPLTLRDSTSAPSQADPVEAAGEPEATAVSVQLGEIVTVLPTRTSPDRDYLWLDRVLGPVQLDAGDHPVVLSYAGTDPDGQSVVDAVWLHPVRPSREWELADGTIVRLELDTMTGERVWTER